MSVPASGIVTVRLAPRDAEAIDTLIQEGRYRNRSDFIRYAIRQALDKASAAEREDRLSARSLIEGPGALPAPEPGRAGTRRPTPSKGVHKS